MSRRDGAATIASMAMIETVIISSITVNPARREIIAFAWLSI
jgi:hypothetical protein